MKSETVSAAWINGLCGIVGAVLAAVIIYAVPTLSPKPQAPQVPSGTDEVYIIGSGTFVRLAEAAGALAAVGPGGPDRVDPHLHILEGATGDGLRFLNEALERGDRIVAMASRFATEVEFAPQSRDSDRAKRRLFEILVGWDRFQVAFSSPALADELGIPSNVSAIEVDSLNRILSNLPGDVALVTTRPPSGTLELYRNDLGCAVGVASTFYSNFRGDVPKGRWIALGSEVLNTQLRNIEGADARYVYLTSPRDIPKNSDGHVWRPLTLYGVMTLDYKGGSYVMDPRVQQVVADVLERLSKGLINDHTRRKDAASIDRQRQFFGLPERGSVRVEDAKMGSFFIRDPHR
jgi:hypothetical protein